MQQCQQVSTKFGICAEILKRGNGEDLWTGQILFIQVTFFNYNLEDYKSGSE